MAKNNNKPEVYKGRRKKLNVLGIVLSALAVLIVAVLVLFGAFQKYIVYQNSGISIDMPILRTPAPEDEQTDESGFAQVNAELEIRDADYSDIEEHVDEDMGSIRAVYVPPESVTAEGIGPYVSKLSSVGGNALVLDLKPVSGQLVWVSSSKIALRLRHRRDDGPGLAGEQPQAAGDLSHRAAVLLHGRAHGHALPLRRADAAGRHPV